MTTLNIVRRLIPWSVGMAILVTTGLPANAQQPAYQLDYGDAVTVTVVGQPALSVMGQSIRPDGMISLPLIREIPVRGRTVEEVAGALTKAFKAFLAEPHVMVNITRFRPLRITLIGQVRQPGTFPFESPPTLIDAVATAGGLSERSARNAITVVSRAGRKTYDLDRLLNGQESMPSLPEGAVVEVGETWMPDWYRILPIAASITTTLVLSRELFRSP